MSSYVPQRLIVNTERDITAAKLRSEGLLLRTIADRLGYVSISGVRRAITRGRKADENIPRRIIPRKRWTDAMLIEAVTSSTSMNQVLMKLGLGGSAGSRPSVRRRMNQLGLDDSHWLGQGWVGRTGTPPGQRPLDNILVENSTYSTSLLRDRLIKAGLKEPRCENCDLTEWLGQPIPIEVDHINGIPDDHRIINLRFLCPNCHALTPTWRGRKNRRKVVALCRSS